MKKLTLIAAASCMLATSCTLTGDPTQGGIFWSPTKAQARQMNLRAELYQANTELAAKRRTTAALASTRDKLDAELRDVNAQLEAAKNGGGDSASLQARKAKLEAQLRNLR